MEQTYVVLEQRIRQSRYGQHIIEIDLVGCQDRQQYQIDWDRIRLQVREAAEQLANFEKEPEMKKKGRKKKGY